jgi:predicted enzyme related to lactoylglutathione lyase
MLGLRTVIFHVTDLDKAKAWYTDVLGKPPYFDEPFYVGFNIGGFEFGLHPTDKPVITGNNITAYWGVEDAARSFETLVAKGGEVYEPLQDVGEGIIVAAIKDPFGNLFGIIKNPNFRLESH